MAFFFLIKGSFSRKEGFANDRFGISGGAIGSLNTAWENRAASDYVHILATKYGQPSAVDPSSGGMAIWKADKLANGCLERIEIKDEAISHCVPVNHLDYVYAYVRYDLPTSRFLDVSALSGTIGYDTGRSELRARCGTIEAAIATLALATQIGEGHISLNYANANDLLGHYLTASQDPNQAARLNDLLCYNVKHQQGKPFRKFSHAPYLDQQWVAARMLPDVMAGGDFVAVDGVDGY